MRWLSPLAISSLGCAFLWTNSASGQFGRGSDWTTAGGDAQRSGWVRSDAKISRASLQKPGFQFLWKMKLTTDSQTGQPLSPPALLDRYIGYRGFRSLGFLGGSADKVFAIDTDLSRMEWEKQLAAGTASRRHCGPMSARSPTGTGSGARSPTATHTSG